MGGGAIIAAGPPIGHHPLLSSADSRSPAAALSFSREPFSPPFIFLVRAVCPPESRTKPAGSSCIAIAVCARGRERVKEEGIWARREEQNVGGEGAGGGHGHAGADAGRGDHGGLPRARPLRRRRLPRHRRPHQDGVRQAVRRGVAVRGGRQLRVLLHPHQRHLHLLLPRAPLLPPLQGRRRRRLLLINQSISESCWPALSPPWTWTRPSSTFIRTEIEPCTFD